jgi:hypothetical protein
LVELGIAQMFAHGNHHTKEGAVSSPAPLRRVREGPRDP